MSCFYRLILAVTCISQTSWANDVMPRAEQRLQMDEGIQLQDYSAPAKGVEEAIQQQKETRSGIQIDLQKILKETDTAQPRDSGQYQQKSIADIRTEALKNNLSLRVIQADPNIVQTRLNEERAKFDNIIYANLKYGEYDFPERSGNRVKFSSDDVGLNNGVVKQTIQNQRSKDLDGELGIAIPLRTGGVVNLSSPFQNNDKSSPFASDEYRTGLRFSVSQPLLRDAGVTVNEATINIAAFDQVATTARARLQSIRVVAMIDKAYWALNQAWTELEIRRQQYEYASQNLAMVQRRVNEGLSANIELNRAEFGVTDRIEQLIVANTNLKLAQRQLKFLLNDNTLPLEKNIGIAPTTSPTLFHYSFDREKLLAQASVNRLELLEVEIRLSEDALRIDYLQNQTLPLFTVDYSYGALSNSAGSLGSAYGNTLDGNFNDWYIGFRFEMPVTNEARKARLSRAVEQRLQRLSTKELQDLTVKREIHDSLDVVEQQWQRIVIARQQVGIAGMNYDAELKQFKEGLRTMTEVLEMLTRLGDAQIREIRAITDYQVSLVDLSFATGTLLGYSNISFPSQSSVTIDE
ncbi:MAG: TolC family protein [Methylotenera sp.]|nr:TolC family protein [Methylotenera sp.]